MKPLTPAESQIGRKLRIPKIPTRLRRSRRLVENRKDTHQPKSRSDDITVETNQSAIAPEPRRGDILQIVISTLYLREKNRRIFCPELMKLLYFQTFVIGHIRTIETELIINPNGLLRRCRNLNVLDDALQRIGLKSRLAGGYTLAIHRQFSIWVSIKMVPNNYL